MVAAPAVAAPVAQAVFCGLQLRRVARAAWCGVSGAVGDGVCVCGQRSRVRALILAVHARRGPEGATRKPEGPEGGKEATRTGEGGGTQSSGACST